MGQQGRDKKDKPTGKNFLKQLKNYPPPEELLMTLSNSTTINDIMISPPDDDVPKSVPAIKKKSKMAYGLAY